jgi:hypothetical protein
MGETLIKIDLSLPEAVQMIKLIRMYRLRRHDQDLTEFAAGLQARVAGECAAWFDTIGGLRQDGCADED